MNDPSTQRLTFDTSDEVSAEQSELILRQRAQRLAQVPHQQDDGEVLELISFGLGDERLCLSTRFVHEVIHRTELTIVPRRGDLLAGITSVRGRITAVFDLSELLSIAKRPREESSVAILLVGDDEPEFAVSVDEIGQVITLRRQEIAEPPAGISQRAYQLLQGISAESELILDGDRLLQLEELWIDDME